MRISRIQINNFRNFRHCDLNLGEHAVIVGENKIGKSNLVYALRLVLDPRMSDAERHLRIEDFWDGISRPLTKDDVISISVDLADFEDDDDLLALLAEHLIQPEPMVAQLTYLYRPVPYLDRAPQKEADYEFIVFGGGRPEKYVGYELRASIPMTVLPALRNAEDDLSNWRRSPLAPLLQSVASQTDPAELEAAAGSVFTATTGVSEIQGIRSLGTQIKERLVKMVGSTHAVDTSLGFSPSDPLRLIKTLRLFIDGGVRSISDASLGCANLIYLSLLSLELERQVAEGKRGHTFLAIEEPEAHLHPHLQRLAFKDFLRPRVVTSGPTPESESSQTILLTTHSPHIVSVAPLKSLVILKKSEDGLSTVGASAAQLTFDESTTRDLERYLDVSRGECVFAKGLLFVEGIAEEYIVPVMAKLLGYDFDQLGITVCSVGGTNFEPYVRLFGPEGFNVPFAVLTDLDPQNDGQSGLGETRVCKLVQILDPGASGDLLSLAPNYGLFLNEFTLEIDLFRSGQHRHMCEAITELTTNGAARARARVLASNPASLDQEQFLKDVGEIGKGRFAQRLASRLDGGGCPTYMANAISYVAERIR
jgi:putative ATP-dependent endonuclease of the OLD family